MSDRPLKKRLKKSSAEPETQAGPMNGKAGRGVMGLNPLVGHKVDRFWADVSARTCRHPSWSCIVSALVCTRLPRAGGLAAWSCGDSLLMLSKRWACQSLNSHCAMCRTTSGGTASSPTSTVSLASTGEHSKLAQPLPCIYTQNVPSALHLPSITGISICFVLLCS